MNIYGIILIIIGLLSISTLIYFVSYNTLNKYRERMKKAEEIIDEQLTKKLDLIVTINAEVKKVTGKKDYLKDYVEIKDLVISNIEKDWKLDEAEKLIKDLTIDFSKLNKSVKFNKLLDNLRDIDEILTSAKNIFNENALLSNKKIKNFPNNIVSKIAGIKIRGYFNNKKEENNTF